MQINAISLNQVYSNQYKIKNKYINFAQKQTSPLTKDTICFTGIKTPVRSLSKNDLEQFATFLEPIYQDLKKITDEHSQSTGRQMKKDDIKAILQKFDTNDYQIMGVGTNSICYKVKNPSGSNAYGIRFFRPDAMNYGNDSTYEKEAFALRKVQQTGIEDAQELVGLVEKDGRHYIITNLAQGIPLNAQEGRMLNPRQAKDVLKKLTQLDKSGFVQYDAQLENIFFNGDKAELIDFGGFSVSAENKSVLDALKQMGVPVDYESFYPNFSALREGSIKEFNLEELLKSTKPYLGFSDIDTTFISRNSNPYFSGFSNVANFEYRSLFYHLQDTINATGTTQTAEDIFKSYLHQKAFEHHKTMSDFFGSLNPDEVASACRTDKGTILKRIKDAIGYEKLLTGLLSKDEINENVLKTELAKIQMRWVALNKKEAAQTQFESLTSMIKEFRDQDSLALGRYYDDSLSFFDKLKAGIYALAEGNKREVLDSKYNLVEKLFIKTVQSAKEEIKPEVLQTQAEENIKTGSKNNKIIAIILGIAAFVGSIFIYITHRKNKEKLNESHKVPQSQTNSLNAALQNNDISSSSKVYNPFSMQDFLNTVK